MHSAKCYNCYADGNVRNSFRAVLTPNFLDWISSGQRSVGAFRPFEVSVNAPHVQQYLPVCGALP